MIDLAHEAGAKVDTHSDGRRHHQSHSVWFVSHRGSTRITVPIETLSKATDDFAEGRADEDISLVGDDELAHLTQSFNTMRRAIREYETELVEAKEVAVHASQAKADFLARGERVPGRRCC